MLGFKKQIIFSTLSAKAPFSTKLDTRVKYGAIRAHTRAMTAFCGDDDRLMGMACISLDDPALAANAKPFLCLNDACSRTLAFMRQPAQARRLVPPGAAR